MRSSSRLRSFSKVFHSIAHRSDISYNISIDYNFKQSLATYIEAHRTYFVVEGFTLYHHAYADGVTLGGLTGK
jgi:hypothetical protein